MKNVIQKGFTLIELLVVITIIGILATGAVTTFTSQIQKARDTTRIGDVKALQGGIEQFYQDVSEYPAGTNGWLNGGQIGSTVAVTDYVPNLAEDPKHNQTCNQSRCGYVYAVGADTNDITNGAYEISTAFENEGNRSSKGGGDDGEDNNRLELGSLKTGNAGADLVTLQAQATGFTEGAAAAATTPLVVKNSTIVTK